jgi:hypothetical protein
MTLKKMMAAGIVAVTALSAVPAGAASLSFDFGRGNVELGFNGNAQRGGWDNDERHGRWDNHRDRHRVLSTQDVRRILRGKGYRDIEYLDRQGAVYQARATRDGRRYGLVVSARDGDILNRYRLRGYY